VIDRDRRHDMNVMAGINDASPRIGIRNPFIS
jgi:hypothetical protein